MPDAPAAISAAGSAFADRVFFGHPRGLAILFFTEMWERFSYYGMRALLILFMTASTGDDGLGLSVSSAGMIYGLYTALAYMAALPGGWIADRILGQRAAVLYGGFLIAFGNLILAVPGVPSFYLGLAFVISGTGLLKPNVSAIVGQLYQQGDPRRDAGFSLFYMGINFGAFLSPLVCGWAAAQAGWRVGFVIAGAGMLLGLIQYVLGSATLGNAGLFQANSGTKAAQRHLQIGLTILFLILATAAVLSMTGNLNLLAVANASGAVLLGVVVSFFGWMFFSAQWTPLERQRLIVVLILFIASAVFWSVFEQAGSSMNLFAQRSTDNNVGGFNVPAPWYQSINALFIISLAPAFGVLWLRLRSREPSSPAKFAWGLVLVGIGFLILAAGASLSENGQRVSPMWLIVAYLFHTAGELCLSPVGLSAMTKLAPARVAGLMMGVWFLSLSVGNYLGGRLASLYESLPLFGLFGAVGLFAIFAGLVLAKFVRPMVRLMAGAD